jgi:GNAT superfamily N-acetyltransferase
VIVDVRDARREDAAAVATISAAAFYDDPVMCWAFPDPGARLAQLHAVFTGLVRDYLPDRGTVHLLDDGCATFWRRPDFVYGSAPQSDSADGDSGASDVGLFPADVLERLIILDAAMAAAHPHEPHWYLNVIGTVPERQGTGLGGRTMAPVLAICDADGLPAYLESSNPRNMTLYRRQGFEQTGEIPLPDGPSLYPMWREPPAEK